MSDTDGLLPAGPLEQHRSNFGWWYLYKSYDQSQGVFTTTWSEGDPASWISIYEGNNIASQPDNRLIVNNEGASAYTVLYGNYANNVLINNTDGGTTYIHGNTANGAELNNTNGSRMEVLFNSVVGAEIVNSGDSAMIIHGNDATGVTITNAGGGASDASTLSLLHNNATGAIVHNMNAGVMNIYGNIASGSQVTTDAGSTTYIGDCSQTVGCEGEPRGTTFNDGVYDNYGTSFFSGNIDFSDGRLINHGVIHASDLTLAGGVINNVGGEAIISGTNAIGTLDNSAVVRFDGPPGSVLRIAGNYTGHDGTIVLNTELGGDASPTDRLAITGDTSGTSLVRVVNAGGQGALTAEGIEIISVGGRSNGTFSLAGDYLVAGEYTYRLHKNNFSGTDPNDWYLRSELSSGQPEYHVAAPVYESYAQALLGLNGVGTLQQRVGNREWPAPSGSGASLADGSAWVWVQGTHSRVTPRDPTIAGTRYDQDAFKLQLGADKRLAGNTGGAVVGSVFAQYVHGNTRTRATNYANGRIATDGYGLGGAVTWYGNSGFYLDGLAQVMWFRSDLSSSAAGGALKNDSWGMGYALSAEAGKRYAIAPNWSLTPQAQLTASRVDFDDFQDRFGSTVRLSRGDSVEGRLGVTLDYETSQSGANGAVTSRTHVYGIANLYHEFRDGTRVRIEDLGFESKADRLRGGIGVGGSHNWGKGRYSLYGEVLADTSLRNFGDSYSVNGTVGVRLMW
uniref:autotransporter family protein n=1 Tax=Castellaniella defragrans TaxID=75697 RepID=UPI003340DAC6